jgi:hypothetical protein
LSLPALASAVSGIASRGTAKSSGSRAPVLDWLIPTVIVSVLGVGAAPMGAIIYGAFFVAVFAMPVYGGGAYDDNGYLPFAAPLPIVARKWDVNITAFSVLTVLLIAGVVSISAAAAG